MVGFSELLLELPDALDDRDKARHYLKLIHTGAGDAASVVRRLREFYREREPDEQLSPLDVVFTDGAMPDMNGPRLAGLLKMLSPDLPIVLLTGFGDLMSSEQTTAAGVDQVVGKPLTGAKLREALARVTTDRAA